MAKLIANEEKKTEINTNGIETKKFLLTLQYDLFYSFVVFLAFFLFQLFLMYSKIKRNMKYLHYREINWQVWGYNLFILMTLKSRPNRNQIKTNSFFF